jgi:hypothetical protein
MKEIFEPLSGPFVASAFVFWIVSCYLLPTSKIINNLVEITSFLFFKINQKSFFKK